MVAEEVSKADGPAGTGEKTKEKLGIGRSPDSLPALDTAAFEAWLVAGDPDCTRWRGVIGRVLQKTTILFMIAAALDIVVTYAAVPQKIGRLTDIFFIIAFSLDPLTYSLHRSLIHQTRGKGKKEKRSNNGTDLYFKIFLFKI